MSVMSSVSMDGKDGRTGGWYRSNKWVCEPIIIERDHAPIVLMERVCTYIVCGSVHVLSWNLKFETYEFENPQRCSQPFILGTLS